MSAIQRWGSDMYNVIYNFLDTLALKIFLDTNHYYNPAHLYTSIVANHRTLSNYIEFHTGRIISTGQIVIALIDKAKEYELMVDLVGENRYSEELETVYNDLFNLILGATFPIVYNVSTNDRIVIRDSFKKFIKTIW